LIKREERLENVQRISRANQFAKEQIKKKIEDDNMKGINLREGKDIAIKTRLQVR
jgi:hypothetical protein